MNHPEMPILAFLAALLVLLPLPHHWKARNIATLTMIGWLSVSNMIFGINSILWANKVDIKLVVWCDIVAKIQMGANVALPAACFCLDLHLARVASTRNVKTTLSDKRRRMIFESVVCIGVPIVYMALHYIVQGHRFDIVEGFGCRPTTFVSWPAILIVWVIPLALAIGACINATRALCYFVERRSSFANHLQDSNSGLTTSRYFRLLALSGSEMCWGILVTSLNMWFTFRHGILPWTSWDDVHFQFSGIGQFPTLFIPQSELAWTFFLWWTIPISAFLFFGFFSFGQESMRDYRACIAWFSRVILRRKPDDKKAVGFTSFPRSIGSPRPPRFVNISIETKVDTSFSAPTKELFYHSTETNGVVTPHTASSYRLSTLALTDFSDESLSPTRSPSSASLHSIANASLPTPTSFTQDRPIASLRFPEPSHPLPERRHTIHMV